MAKKNPIKKRKQGSQSPNPNTPGNPKKYMGDNEWEQYNEPQNPKKSMVNPEGFKAIGIGETLTELVNKEMTENFGGQLGDMGMMTPMHGSDGKFAIPDAPMVIDPRAGEKVTGNKAPTKKVAKTVKKSYQDENFEDELSEMIRVPIFTLISGDYEVMDCETKMGYARVVDGVIAELVCTDSAKETYRGEVLTNLLKTIIDEADMQNSPLSLQLADKDDEDMKRFLERFGFRAVGHGVMQRTAGAVSPPSVQYTDGMEDEEPDR